MKEDPIFEGIASEISPWLYHVANRYSEGPVLSPSDLMQEALVILVGAVKNYKEIYGFEVGSTDFMAMLKVEIRHKMIDLVRYVRSPCRDSKKTISGHTQEESQRSSELWDTGIFNSRYKNPVEILIEKEYFQGIYSKLNESERKLLETMLDPPPEFAELMVKKDKEVSRARKNKPAIWLFGQVLGWKGSFTIYTWQCLHKKLLEVKLPPVRKINGSRALIPVARGCLA